MALKLRSDAPFCATMMSEFPARMIALEVCRIPSVTALEATTVAVPTDMPSTVSSVRTR
jgi:hypothetical protein